MAAADSLRKFDTVTSIFYTVHLESFVFYSLRYTPIGGVFLFLFFSSPDSEFVYLWGFLSGGFFAPITFPVCIKWCCCTAFVSKHLLFENISLSNCSNPDRKQALKTRCLFQQFQYKEGSVSVAWDFHFRFSSLIMTSASISSDTL